MPDENQNLITAVDPSGQLVQMPLVEFDKARADGHSYMLAQVAPKIQEMDLVPDDPERVKVLDPQNQEISIPKNIWNTGEPGQNGYKLLSQVDREKQRLIKQTEDLELLKRSDTLGLASSSSEAATKHAGDDVITLHNQFKLQAPNGEDVDVSRDELLNKLNQGFTFRDPDFQALFDARMKHFQENPDLFNQIATGARQAEDTISFGLSRKAREWDQGAIDDIKTNNDERASAIAAQLLTAQKYQTAQSVGTGIGIVGPILATGGTGLLGEGALAGKVATGVRDALGAGTAGASLPLKIGAGIAGEAAAGATIATPQALSNLILDKDPKQAAESLLWGIGTGGAVGIGMAGLGRYATPSNTQILQNISKEPGTAAAIEKLSSKYGVTPEQFINKIMSSSKLSNLEFVQQLRLGNPGSITQAFSKTGDEAIKSSPELAEAIEKENVFHSPEGKELSREEAAGRLENILKQENKSYTKAIESLDGAVAKNSELESMLPKTNSIVSELEKIKSNLVESDITKPMFREIDKAVDHIQAVAKNSESLSFAQTKELDQLFTNKILNQEFETGSQKAMANGIRKQIASVISDELNNRANSVVAAGTDPQLAEIWGRQNVLRDSHSTLADTLEALKNPQKPIPEWISHLLGHRAGGFHAITSLLTGHPTAAAMFVGATGVKHLVNTFLENNQFTKLKSFYKRSMESPNIGSYVAIDADAITQKHLSQIPTVLRTMADEGAVKLSQPNSIKHALGEEANGLSMDQQFNKLSHHIATMATNPDISMPHIKSLSAPLAAHPELQKQFEDALNNKIQYLYSILPKNPNKPQPFVKDSNWKPSPAQLDDFKQQLAVANNPFHVLDALKAGTLTSSQVATLSVINPSILAKMRSEIIQAAYTKKPNLSYQQKLNTAVLLGESIDDSLNNINQLQAAYGQISQATPPPPMPKSHKSEKNIQNDKLPSSQTLAQRLGAK